MSPYDNSLGFLAAFFGGVVVSFSPCVLPLIPVTLSFIGVEAESSSIKGLLLSLVYVLGLAFTYAILGLVAALTGTLFGRIASHPLSYFIIGNSCIIAGLAFLDVFHFHFPGVRIHGKIARTGGFIPAFLFGIASGLVVGPCTTPVLGTILIYVAHKQNIAYGLSLLFTFALGMGTVLLLAGFFGAEVFHYTHSAVWSKRLKRAAGFILIILGEYFLIKAGRLM